MNVIDGFILATLLLGAYGGYRNGLVMSMAGLICHIAGLAGAFFLYRPVTDFLNNQFGLDKMLVPVITDILPLPAQVAEISLEKVSFAQVAERVSQFKIPGEYAQQMINMVKDLEQLAQAPGVETLG
ncbi:MAG: CvpA family protein [Clostridia bacterium]|nr:CvpA family protein [Clostridia bacterium]